MSKPNIQVMKQVSALNQLDTAPNPNPNPMDPMSKVVRAVPMPKTPTTVLN